jgi:hypothetical protein
MYEVTVYSKKEADSVSQSILYERLFVDTPILSLLDDAVVREAMVACKGHCKCT